MEKEIVKRKVIELCGRLCFYCHKKCSPLEVVRKVSKKSGGTDHFDNLLTICSNCSRSKGEEEEDDDTFDDFRWKLMQETGIRPRCDYIRWNSWENAGRCRNFVGDVDKFGERFCALHGGSSSPLKADQLDDYFNASVKVIIIVFMVIVAILLHFLKRA